MTASRRPFCRPAAVSLVLLVAGSACTPSNGSTRTARAGADSTAEGAHESVRNAPSPVASQDPPEESTSAPLADPPLAPAPAAPPAARVAVRPVRVPQVGGPYSVRIVDASHQSLPTYSDHGRTYVLGEVGERYSIAVHNPTGRRVEAVVSVDGLDAMDGHPANYADKRGYILPAYGDFTIDGFRTSYDAVATFRFSSVASSYAGRLGQPRDVGVIGVAFFPEETPPAPSPAPPVAHRHYSAPRRAPAKEEPFDDPADLVPAPRAHASSSLAPGAASGGGGGGGGGSSAPTTPPSATAGRARATDEEVARKSVDRPGLGTEFGEARDSHVDIVSFVRASSTVPAQVVALRYNDRAGLVALGFEIPAPYASTDRDLHLRETADPFRENRFAQPPP